MKESRFSEVQIAMPDFRHCTLEQELAKLQQPDT